MLISAGTTLFSLYYAYDLPAALNYSLKFNSKNNQEAKIGALYTSYSLPNILMPYICVKLFKSTNKNQLLYLGIIAIVGQMFFNLGIFLKSLTVMLVGRILFGIGCESYSAIQSRKIVDCFKNNNLSAAINIYNVLGRLGTLSNFLVTPMIAKISDPIFAGIFSTFIVILSIQYYHFTFKISKSEQNANLSQEMNAINIDIAGEMFKTIPKNLSNEICDENYESIFVKNRILCLKILYIVHFLYSMIWLPYYNYAPMIYQKRFNVTKEESGRLMGLLEGSSIVTSIIISFVIDRLGFQIFSIFTGILLLGIAHILLLFSKSNSYATVILLGSASPLFLNTWSLIGRITSKENEDEIFAMFFCLSNLAIIISSSISLLILKNDTFASTLELYFITLVVLLFLAHSCLAFKVQDYQFNYS